MTGAATNIGDRIETDRTALHRRGTGIGVRPRQVDARSGIGQAKACAAVGDHATEGGDFGIVVIGSRQDDS